MTPSQGKTAAVHARRAWPVAVAVLVSLAGCSMGAGSSDVDGDQVAENISAKLEEQVGTAPEKVSCPEDLPAKKGASIRCEITGAGQTLSVTVTTTKVDGSDVDYAIKVDQPSG